MSTQMEMFEAMLHARSALVMGYINYIDTCSKYLYERYNTPKTSRDLIEQRKQVEILKTNLSSLAEAYSYYFSRYYELSKQQEFELTRRILEDTYPPLVPVPVENLQRHLYPGKPDWLSDPSVKG